MRGYEKYIQGVKSGKTITCSYIKQAIERFEGLRAREDIYFDEDCVNEAVTFISNIKHFLGKSAGKYFILEPWQEFIVACLLGLKWKESGYRVCRETYIQIARKAGKDAFMAALAIYMMIVDGEASPEIACLGNSRDQARILFDYITNFSKSLDPKGSAIKAYRNYVKCPANNGVVKVFSADASKLDGLNVSMAVVDEYHEAKDRKLYDVMKSSMGMRTQPLMVVITTAGFNLESPCHDMYKLSLEVLSGVKNDDTFFPFLFQLDVDDDIEDENNWYKCQPNLGVTVSLDFMRGELVKMKNDATAEMGIKTKTFNMWCTSSMVWIQPEVVVQNMQGLRLEDYIGYTGVIGVDLGSVNDLTAVSLMIPMSDKKVFFNWSFLPEETYKNHPNKELYEKFIREGSLILTPGNVTDYDYISNKIREINEVVPVTDVYYDKWSATQWAIQMTEMGFNLTEFSQAIGNYNACTKEFQRLMLTNELVIDRSANFLWQMTCVSLKVDHNGNVKPQKTAWQTQKIDNIISCTTALGGWLKAGGCSNDFEIFTL
ncbi:terminase large subunit [Fusobacterium ulcerans]|uniref:terminase large subunit n=1 Tax=Fusobacterium ulcerans TaxID=861 RepID=UPI002E761119|nr:terminase TerL endonuclease subunit [Fusobacterium ulcerans]MEE0136842.1 terminase TerL endonuclease subunit [Fusobacterium ulcerans]